MIFSDDPGQCTVWDIYIGHPLFMVSWLAYELSKGKHTHTNMPALGEAHVYTQIKPFYNECLWPVCVVAAFPGRAHYASIQLDGG